MNYNEKGKALFDEGYAWENGIKIDEKLLTKGACIVMHKPKPWKLGKMLSIL